MLKGELAQSPSLLLAFGLVVGIADFAGRETAIQRGDPDHQFQALLLRTDEIIE